MINQMVISKDIEWIGYEKARKMLQVEFLAGGIYQYDNVPEFVFHDFLNADSHGRFFDKQVRSQYAHRKVR